ncbi:MAG TPA: Stp1/IreP family PP2C-type Ser/Thr phosphatase [Candidatus Eremiobacteraeota bacterium]|nr:Stp1/IreP family PP2C-type Ser/Thr phosphatase [Candidatus Eremiobacteraeota bacterium]
MKAAGLSDTGKSRSNNQDSFSIDIKNKIFIVADGMGGHYGGEVASGTTVKEINNYWQKNLSSGKTPDYHIRKAIHKVNKQIFSLNKNMGTTLEVLVIADNAAWIGHIGDSRIYRWRNNKIELLTNDHTKVKELMDSGHLDRESAKHYPFQHVITKAIGIEPLVWPDVFSVDLQAGDIIIMCSDGLTGDMSKKIVSEEDMADILETNLDMEQSCKEFVHKANEVGGPDNITVVLIKIDEEDIKEIPVSVEQENKKTGKKKRKRY